MKILKLRLKNLNSLAGEWEIDFTAKEYSSNGIFAITGATGAGKTTILDAICLALYGKTPRILHISQKNNEIMTRQTGDCFAELTYETVQGVYTNFWGQSKARKKADGKLQAVTHEVSDIKTKKILATKIKDVKNITEEKTGMDFEQFTRSILLAQGSFSAFLKASSDQRASILEQITGSEIYTEISITVHEQERIQKTKLELINEKLSNLYILTDYDKKEFYKVLKENENNVIKLNSKIKQFSDAMNWLNNIDVLNKELKEVNLNIKTLKQKQESFSNDKERLKIANLAKELEVEYDKLLTQRKSLNKDENLQKRNNKEIKVLDNLFNQSLENLKIASCAFDTAKKEQEIELLLIKDVQILDAEIKTKLEDAKQYQKELNEIQNSIKKNLNSKISIEKELIKAENDIKSASEYLLTNAVDKNLINDLSGIKENLKSFNNLKKEQDALKKELEITEKNSDDTKKKNDVINKKLTKMDEDLLTLIVEQKKLSNELKELLNNATIDDLRDNKVSSKDDLTNLEKLELSLSNLDKNKHFLIETEATRKTAQIADKDNKKILEEVLINKKQIEESIQILMDNIALHNKIQSLEAERTKLKDGEECPLCGAVEHPFAKNNIPQMNNTENQLIKKQNLLKKTINSIKDLEKKVITNQELVKYKIKEIENANITMKKLINNKNIMIKQLNLNTNSVSIKFVKNKIIELSKKIKDITKTISKTVIVNTKIDKLNAQIANKKEEQSKLSKQVIADNISLKYLNDEVDKLYENLKKIIEINENIKLQILKKITQFNIKDLKNAENLLNNKKTLWLKNQEMKNKLEYNLQNIKNKLAENKLLHNSQYEQENKSKNKQVKLNDIVAALTLKRTALYADKKTDKEEFLIKKKVDGLDKATEQAKNLNNKRQNDFNNLTKQIVLLDDKINKTIIDIKNKEVSFKEQLSKSSFQDEQQFILAILSKEKREMLNIIKDNLHTSQTQLDTNFKNITTKLNNLQKQKLTDDTIENLRNMQVELNDKLKELNEAIGELKQKLKIDFDNRKNQSKILKNKELQQNKTSRWQKLRELIGSNDGKKYRTFAQGLTFDIMIYYANIQLTKMSKRYFLTRNIEEPLELKVSDNYQANEIRSTKNLSGGESFIVSLALALGLSQMASHKIKVDSLFLDEGFGTLDDEALSIALDTLSNLKQSGKLIGIISHISSLKERISSQIQVTTKNNGTSEISGPGIRMIK